MRYLGLLIVVIAGVFILSITTARAESISPTGGTSITKTDTAGTNTTGMTTASAKKGGDSNDNSITFGGSIKAFLFDKVWGSSTVSGVKKNNTQNDSLGFGGGHAFTFFIAKQISDQLSVEVDPEFSMGSAGATPSLGKYLGAQKKSTSTATDSFSFYQSYIKYDTHWNDVQLRAGYMNLPFTQDYGRELFWEEEYNVGRAMHEAAWHDTGIEIYRNFELGNVSLPAYLYVLNGYNGQDYGDNNNDKSVMVHVEPEFGGTLAGLKTFASYGAGDWGDEAYQSSYSTALPTSVAANLKSQKYDRYSVGASYSYQKFTIRSEYAGGTWDNYYPQGTKIGTADKYEFGYYVKLFYKIIPDKLTAMYHYDNLHENSSATVRQTWEQNTVDLQYQLAPAATLMLILDKFNIKDNAKNKLDYNRVTIGTRITF